MPALTPRPGCLAEHAAALRGERAARRRRTLACIRSDCTAKGLPAELTDSLVSGLKTSFDAADTLDERFRP